MKKKYNLFSVVVSINLIMTIVTMPRVVAESVGGVDEVGSVGGVDSDEVGGIGLVGEVDEESEVVGELKGDNGVEGDDELEYDELEYDDGLEDDGIESLPILYIKAINPGYKVDGINDVGEMIEIGKSSDDLISLAGVTVRYTNLSGNETVLVEFPENSYMAGESLLLRFDGSPEGELANATYKTTLALKAGPLALLAGDEVIDSVCWTNKDGCEKYFTSSKPTTLVRYAETGEFEHVAFYEPEYEEGNYVIVEDIDDEGGDEVDGDAVEDLDDEGSGEGAAGDGAMGLDDEGGIDGDENVEGDASDGDLDDNVDENSLIGDLAEDFENETKEEAGSDIENEMVMSGQCVGLAFSEVLSYYAESQTEQFIELYNAGIKPIVMKGCAIRYKGKTYALDGEVAPGEYTVRYAEDFKLTKNPTSSNVLEILDADAQVVDTLEYYNGQKKGASWALVGYEAEEEIWRTTYAVTPGVANVEQDYRACESGKVINEVTGKCMKAVDDVDEEGKGEVVEKVCAEGQYLNPLTGRCKRIEDEAEEKVCAAGYYLNEETGRCRKIVEEVVKTCQEGYYLNEETGRCRKVVEEVVKTCQDGYYLNEETGRCKKITEEVVKTCAEGYYLNEETGRCKKIVENTGADYELKTETYEEESAFVALYMVLAVVGLATVYVIWEFRREIRRFCGRIFRRKER